MYYRRYVQRSLLVPLLLTVGYLPIHVCNIGWSLLLSTFPSAAGAGITVTIHRSSSGATTSEYLTNAGDFYELASAQDEVMSISCSGPMVVAQYSKTCMSSLSHSLIYWWMMNIICKYKLTANELKLNVSILQPITIYWAIYHELLITSAAADGADSDPMMALVPPKEQYGNSYTFTTPTGVSAPYR